MGLFVKAITIRQWAHTTSARSLLPHLIRRLVWATVDPKKLQKVDFPAYESGQRPGFDGEVVCEEGNAWVPPGRSVWELSVEGNPPTKATGDFEKRTDATPADLRRISTYMCVTAQHWQKKKEWGEQQRKCGQWKDVRAFDADDIEQWVELAPAVATWFAEQFGGPPDGCESAELRWATISASTERPLIPEVFLASREESLKRLHDWLKGPPGELVIFSRSPGEVIDFFCAAGAAADDATSSFFTSRAVIVQNDTAWQVLRDSTFPLVLVVEPQLQLTAEEIARAVNCGHHVLICIEPGAVEAQNSLELERAGEFKLQQALEKCGFTPVQAQQAARTSGGSLAILKRKLSRFRTRPEAKWDSLASHGTVAACLLVGGWDGAKAADRGVLEAISGCSYDKMEAELQRLATCREPMLLHAGSHWRVISKDEAWFVLGNVVTPANVKALCEAARRVLADDDPRYLLPDKERIYAPIRGHVPQFSSTIKTHVAQTVAFLGAFGNKLEAGKNVNIAYAMADIVRGVLDPPATWRRWASLGERLALLAEACPCEFLRIVSDDLDRAEPELLKLLREEEEPFFGACNHAGLLWAVETLAWSNRFLASVGRILIKLAASDPGGRWGNRPSSSLHEILSYWMPQTTASIDERIALLDVIARAPSDAAWDVIVRMLPDPTGGVSSPTHRPMWQNWANSWTGAATHAEIWKFVTATANHAIRLAGADAARWKKLFENLSRFPWNVHTQLLQGIARLAESNLSEADRRCLSEELSEQINRNRCFKDADDSLPTEILGALKNKLERLKPQSCTLRNAWLFAPSPDRYFVGKVDSYEEHKAAIEASRQQAIREILDSHGIDGVRQLVLEAEASDIVGSVVAQVTCDEFLGQIIPEDIAAGDKRLNFVAGFVWARFRANGWMWVDHPLSLCREHSDKAWLLTALPFEPETWRRAAAAGARTSQLYWQRCRAWNCELDEPAIRTTVESLVEHKRPGDAIDFLAMSLYRKKQVAAEVILLPLESLLKLEGKSAIEQAKRASPHDIATLIQSLQLRTDVSMDRLCVIELNYLGVLTEFSGHAPQTLHRQMSTTPSFFIEVLSLLFRGKDEQSDEGNEEQKQLKRLLANRCFNLLYTWKLIPGTTDTGAIDEDALQTWCSEVRKLAHESNRLEVCDSTIGSLFAHAPADADGSWPCAAVRNVVERIASKSLGTGLSCGIYNKRGTVSRGKGGDQERELVRKYSELADKIRIQSPFVAGVLDGLVASYKDEARYWDEQDRWGE